MENNQTEINKEQQFIIEVDYRESKIFKINRSTTTNYLQ